MVLISLSAREDALRVSVPAWVQAVAAQGAEARSAVAVELAPADAAAGPGDAAARPVGAAAALAAQAGAAEARASLTARLGAGSRFATEVEVGSEPRSCCLPSPAPPHRQRMLRAVASPQSAGGPDSGWRAAPGWFAPSGRAGVAPV